MTITLDELISLGEKGLAGDWSHDDELNWTEATQPEKLESALSELKALRDAQAWQPIETAPKDGTPVLIGGDRLLWAAGFNSTRARYIEHEIEYWHIDDGKFGPWPLRGPAPTHWRPLPPAPAPTRQDGAR